MFGRTDHSSCDKSLSSQFTKDFLLALGSEMRCSKFTTDVTRSMYNIRDFLSDLVLVEGGGTFLHRDSSRLDTPLAESM